MLREATRLWERAQLPPVFVVLGVNLAKVVPASRARVAAGALVAFVRDVASRFPPHHLLHSADFPRALPDFIRSVRVQWSTSLGQSSWNADFSGWVRELQVADLVSAIDRKTSKYASYRGFDELWLLLLVANRGPSGFLELPPEAAAATFRTPFQRAFVVWEMERQFHELRVAPVGGAPASDVGSPR